MSQVAIIAGIKNRVGLFSSAPDPTNADSVPPTAALDLGWSCAQWMTWYNAYKAKYGQAAAVNAMTQYYGQISLTDEAAFCLYEPTFYNFFVGEGFTIDSTIAPVVADTNTVVQNAANAVTSASTAAASTASELTWLLPLALVVLTAGGAWWGYETFIKKPKASVSGYKKRRRK